MNDGMESFLHICLLWSALLMAALTNALLFMLAFFAWELLY